MKKCPRCLKNKAILTTNYGVLPCQLCQDKEVKNSKTPEFTTQSIKDGRREFKKDSTQPYRGKTLSKEYLEEYGTSGISPTKEDFKNAKYVWKDTKGWWNRGKSKGGRLQEIRDEIAKKG